MKKLDDKYIVVISLALIAICSVILGLVLFWDRVSKVAEKGLPTSTTKFYAYQNSLNGVGEDISTADDQTVAVMIDNHPDARSWQIGISKARIVYEAPVEGSFTRYLALFNSSDAPEKVGPVRSARPYFIDIASEYRAFYLHSGGSPEALDTIKNNSTLVYDTNEFWNGQYFWRADNIDAPHNLFTSGENWQKLIITENPRVNTWRGWSFETVRSVDSYIKVPTILASSTVPVPQGVSISYNKNYEVVWQYDATSSLFKRIVNDMPDKDADGQEVTAKTIIIQKTNIKTIDSEGRKKITTLGEGDASIFSLGKKLDGRWKKINGGRTLFYTNSGEEIIFSAGQIWVEVVPTDLIPKLIE